MEPGARSHVVIVLASMGALPIIAVQLFLIGRGDHGLAAIVGLFELAYIVGCFLLWRRTGLTLYPMVKRLPGQKRQKKRNAAVFVMIVGAVLACCAGLTLGMLLVDQQRNSGTLVTLTISFGSCAVILALFGNYFRFRYENRPSGGISSTTPNGPPGEPPA